jgi:hypothetical protein
MAETRVIGSALRVNGALTVDGALSVTGATTIPSGATITTPRITFAAQAITVTGATGSTAAAVTISAPGLITCSGGTGASGVNLPVPVAGDLFLIKNIGSGAQVYCVGGTINATTGTTAYELTATGSRGSAFMCVTAGTWQVVPLVTISA